MILQLIKGDDSWFVVRTEAGTRTVLAEYDDDVAALEYIAEYINGMADAKSYDQDGYVDDCIHGPGIGKCGHPDCAGRKPRSFVLNNYEQP